MPDLSFFDGSEAWVGEFLKMLPPDRSILYNYVWNAAQSTDANAGFHIGAGLILLTQIGPRYGVFAADGRTPSNLFILCLAPTGMRKTAALKMGVDVSRAAEIYTVLDTTPGSREGFLNTTDEALGGMPQQALVYSEFSDFLGITGGGGKGKNTGHAASLRDVLMKAYDCDSLARTLAGGRDRATGERNEATVIGTDKPMVSLIGAANYYVLSAHMTQTDWLNGFMGRFLIFDGEPARHLFRQGPLMTDGMQRVVDVLRWRNQQKRERDTTIIGPFPKCCMDAPYTDLDPMAYDRLYAWSIKMRQRLQQESNPLVAAAMSRLDALCMRIALLLSLDYGEVAAWRAGWRLTLEEIEPAIFLTERHLEAYRYAAKHVVLNEEEKPIRDIEIALRHADAANRTLTEGEISADTSRNDRTVSDALRTLMSRNVVRKVTKESSNAVRYQIVGGIAERLLYMPSTQGLFDPPAPPAAEPAPVVDLFRR